MLIFFAFDNDDMESSKRRVAFLSSIFLLTRMSKFIVIRSTFCKAAETQKQLLKLNAIQRFFLFFLARYIRILRVHIKSKDVVLEIKVISVWSISRSLQSRSQKSDWRKKSLLLTLATRYTSLATIHCSCCLKDKTACTPSRGSFHQR